MKLRRKQAQATVDINSRLKDLEGLQNLKEAYTGNNSMGDPEEVQENILEISRAITVLQTMSTLYEAEINTIVQNMGGMFLKLPSINKQLAKGKLTMEANLADHIRNGGSESTTRLQSGIVHYPYVM